MIRRLEARDIDTCADVVAHAFWNDPMFVHSMRSDSEKFEFSKFLVNKSHLLNETGIVVENEGKIGGVASLEVDSGRVLTRFAAMLNGSFLKEAMKLRKAINSEGFRFINAYMRFTTSVRPRGRHHYLVFIGVLPKCQGQGIGGEMLRYLHGIVDADESSLGVGLDTENEANVGYYERFGYELVGTKKIGEVEVYVMFRKRKS